MLRKLSILDVLSLNATNLDFFTENYGWSAYASFLQDPQLSMASETSEGYISAYIVGRQETYDSERLPQGKKLKPSAHSDDGRWYGHVCALTVAPDHRRKGLGSSLMDEFEKRCAASLAEFVDLYVRESNDVAKSLYEKRSYEVHQIIPDYYSDGEVGLDLRKEFKRRRGKASSAGETIRKSAVCEGQAKNEKETAALEGHEAGSPPDPPSAQLRLPDTQYHFKSSVDEGEFIPAEKFRALWEE